ncbi:MAG: ligase-associated DNA damage response endonuclease PdeM [Salibacteraceae bacterium]
MTPLEAEVAGEQLWLHPLKGLFWPRENTLMLADLHLGKAAHFRKEGIAVPRQAEQQNLHRLGQLVASFKVERVLFLGDLFHSRYNASWESFGHWMQEFSHIDFELVIGNHDILAPVDYQRVGLKIHQGGLVCGPFLLTHEPLEKPHQKGFNLAGHWHPGARLRGRGRQHLSLPCFYFNRFQGVLPAFGAFTGKMAVKPERGDRIFVVTDQEIMPFSRN